MCVCVCNSSRVCLTLYEVGKSITWCRQIQLVLRLKSLHMQVSLLLRAFLLLQNQKETNVYLTTIAPKIRIALMNWMSCSVSRENFRVRDILNFLFPTSSFLPSFLPSKTQTQVNYSYETRRGSLIRFSCTATCELRGFLLYSLFLLFIKRTGIRTALKFILPVWN